MLNHIWHILAHPSGNTQNTQEQWSVCDNLNSYKNVADINHSYSQQWPSTIANLVYFFKDENKTTNEPQKAEANNKAEPVPKQQGQ